MPEENNQPNFNALIADDNLINQQISQIYFEELGIECVLVEDGQDAVEEANKQDFTFIILDVHMPIMSGTDASKLIREIEKKRQKNHSAIILALTADDNIETEKECFEAGMDGVLVKPLDPERLESILNSFLNKKNRQSVTSDFE